MRVSVENAWGVVEGLDYDQSRSLAQRLNTETELQGLRVRFKPTRYALDLLVKEGGRDAFDPGCRFAWGHFYTTKQRPQHDFEFTTDPYQHQREWFSLIKDLEYFSLEWEMGLGKSKTILDVCQWAHATEGLDALLVVTLKGVHRKWIEKEMPTHMPKGFAHGAFWNTNVVDAGMWIGKNARSRVPLEKSDRFAIAAINFESVHRKKGKEWCMKFLRTRKCAIVIDESQHIKTPTAAVTKTMLKLAPMAERRWITTGTVSSGSTTDPYCQYKFLSPSIVENMEYHQWKSEFTEQEQVGDKTFETWLRNPVTGRSEKVTLPVMEVVGYKNEDKLARMLDPYRSRLLKADCIDLPDKLYRMRSFEMTPAMNKAYTSMLREFQAELDGRTTTATMAMVKLVRLQQIACNFLVPDDVDPLAEDIPGTPIEKVNPRLEALMQELEKARDGVVWSYKRYSLREIADALRTAYGDKKVVEYHGGISDAGKVDAIRRFQDEGSADWFVGNPQSGGTGIDLFRTSNMFYNDNSFNLIQRLQSEDRIHRIGQTLSCTYTDIECLGTIDRQQLRALKEKKDVASLISGDDLKSWLTEAV